MIRHLLSWFCMGSAICSVTLISWAQPPNPNPTQPPIEPFAYDGFRILFQQHGFRSVGVEELSVVSDSPRETAMVIVGDLRAASAMADLFVNFVNRGGALLIATDQGDRGVTKTLGVSLAPGNVVVPRGLGHRGFRDCPVITDLERSHELLQNVGVLVTNRSGYIRRFPAGWNHSNLAFFPRNSSLSEGTRRAIIKPKLMVATDTEGKGRVLVVADHSLFINQMILHGHNAAFAWNCVKWLSGDKRRRNLVFVQDGKLLGEYKFMGQGEPPPLPIDLSDLDPSQIPDIPDQSVLAFANSFIAGLEDNDVFNQFVAGRPRDTRSYVIKRAAVVLIASIMATMFMLWLLFTRSRPQRVVPLPGVPPQDENFIDRRISSLMAGGHLGGMAQRLVRSFFQNLADHVHPEWEYGGQPHVQNPSSFFKRWRLNRQIRQFWHMAVAGNNRRLSARRFNKLVAGMKSLEALRSKGQLRLQWPDSQTAS